MPCSSEHKNTTVIPVQDGNPEAPPIPAGHEPKTPEFLQKLIDELEDLENQSSELWAKRYGSPSLSSQPSKPYRPPYAEKLELDRQDEELGKKISALKSQIRELHVLIPRTVQSKPGLE